MQWIEKYKVYIAMGLIAAIIIGVIVLIWTRSDKPSLSLGADDSSGSVIVDIEGAIKNPGLYKLKTGSIVQDVINLAGGVLDNSDKDKMAQDINRAEKLTDSQKIFIPLKEVASASNTASSSSQSTSSDSQTPTGKININTASAAQLDLIPGVGPTIAGRIIDYRVQNGGFKSTEELKEVKGIGDKTFEKMAGYIKI